MKKKDILQLFIFPIILFLIAGLFRYYFHFFVLHFLFLFFGILALAIVFIVIAIQYYDLYKNKNR
jgi:hypothetical protein